ncbi:Htur_1727 family rSAM-partnered candidate RiPP [Halobaculum magnesiiphilum]|uniref:Htur_1727 family rSAM-partnered candidate RiPP n=1 Tax=Halobaculum magnesiiphilum TaxID=1017351 RepID=A0A8T8WIG7_9EURY|nr:Htur_1727 family rSAM-partnered candidate RiPP [Halobaculum magnesiiphilum]QZP39655.1 Htur_1727 family rSAM-partnered candidate RiPP [Halobaculum magnesiiphilum]
MADTDRRTRVDAARADDAPEWEVFHRESPADPLRHVGSVTAASSDVAHEQASTLFPDASTLWLTRSDRVARFSDRDLGAEYDATDMTADDGGVES